MKIWLDTTSTTQTPLSKSNFDGQCDCCEGTYISNQKRPFFIDRDLASMDENPHISTHLLRITTPLHLQMCGQDYWVACNPVDSGIIAVLDQQAYGFLAHFHQPQSLTAVQASLPEVAPGRIGALATLLYHAGLLSINSDPLPLQKQEISYALTAWMHVTNACNLRCDYCYIDKTSESMPEELAFRAVDAVFRSAIKHGFKKVRLKYAGGEASLHMRGVISVHDYALQLAEQYQLEFSGTLLTNGVVLSQRVIDQLKLRNITITISMDGIGAYHDVQRTFQRGLGSFKYVNATIHRLLTNGLVPHISVTVSQRNLAGLNELFSYILDLGLSFSLNYYRDNDFAVGYETLQFEEQQMIQAMRSAFQLIEQKLPRYHLLNSLIDKSNMSYSHQRTCGVGNSYMVIDQRGGVAKCHADIKSTVSTIDSSDPLQAIHDDKDGIQNLPVSEKEGCRSCDWRYWCGGGCPLLTYRMTKRYDIKSPNCNIYRALFPEAVRLEGLRLLRYETPVVF